jgi:hypothetical protein
MAAHPKCYAFAWKRSELHGRDNCYMKNAAGTPTRQEYSMDAGTVVMDSVPTAAADCKALAPKYSTSTETFTLFCGQDLPGNDLAQFVATSMEGCMKQCNSQDKFRGIVYEASLIHWLSELLFQRCKCCACRLGVTGIFG